MCEGGCCRGLHTSSGGNRQPGHKVLPQVGFLLWGAALRLYLHCSSVDAIKEWRAAASASKHAKQACPA